VQSILAIEICTISGRFKRRSLVIGLALVSAIWQLPSESFAQDAPSYRKLGLDPAPLMPGLMISPTFELSLRQSLIMCNGDLLHAADRAVAGERFSRSRCWP
jgi:hypothetical protein